MLLRTLTVKNYKSFYGESKLNFEPGFNVLLGANSSGKSTVLEAIQISKINNTPHRSLLNIVDQDTRWNEPSIIECGFEFERGEVAKVVAPETSVWVALGSATTSNSLNEQRLNTSLSVGFKNVVLTNTRYGRIQLPVASTETTWRAFGGSQQVFAAKYNLMDGEFREVTNVTEGANILNAIWGHIEARTYRFSSERRVQRSSGHHSNGELLPDASNLAYCLNWLQTHNPGLYGDLTKLVHRIFPTIHWIAAPPNGGGAFELKVHTIAVEKNRGDLAVPIDLVGTGVFNAVAILYIVLTAQTQQLILLEEPNSFLHPRAVRELLAILQENGAKHQFFITTHSSDVLRTLDASTVSLLEYDGIETKVQQTAGGKLFEFRAGLIELGIRLTDLHGCDRVLWVEGETEEAVFPLLLSYFYPAIAQGVAVLKLHSTGDFESTKISAKKVADIYKRLSQGSFLAPPMVAITLDREVRPESQVSQLERDCAGTVYFLPQPMLENYFLHADAIAGVLSKVMNREVKVPEVQVVLSDALTKPECRLKQPYDGSVPHAAKVLENVFSRIGGAGVSYRKTSDGPSLASWILAHDDVRLLELKKWFGSFIQDTNS